MVKKLTRHGNSLALVIDRPILDLLKIDPETPVGRLRTGDRLKHEVDRQALLENRQQRLLEKASLIVGWNRDRNDQQYDADLHGIAIAGAARPGAEPGAAGVFGRSSSREATKVPRVSHS